MKATIEHPKVFISYAWGNVENQQRVIDFASNLVECGIDVLLDRWVLKEGNDKYAYMEKCVTDKSVTHVLLLLDKNYTDKANARKGGVGDETQIISAEIYGRVEQRKFLPIVFTRGDGGEIYKPAYLLPTLHVDLSDSETYDDNFQYLVKLLYGVEIYKKPELGKKPNFVEEEIKIPIKTKIKFDSIKRQTNSQAQKNDFASALNLIGEKIINYKINDIQSSEDYYASYLKKYNYTIDIRDEFLELLKISIYVESSEKQIASFLEETKNNCCSTNTNNLDIQHILIQELFTYIIAFCLKYNLFDKMGYILGKTYFNKNSQVNSYQMFHATYFDMQNLDEAKNETDGKQYYTGTGKIWIENLNFDFCSLKDFVLADSLCYNYSIFSNAKSDDSWFPTLYMFGMHYDSGAIRDWSVRLQSKEKADESIKLFGFDTIDEFKKRFAEVEQLFLNGQFSSCGYPNAFYSAPLLCHYIKSSDIGKYR